MGRLERANRSRRTDPGYGYLHVTADSAEGSGFRLVSDWPIGDNMIITRSPLRISVGGGGTDLPSYYREHCGFVIAAAIDKYVYISLHPMFEQQIFIRYSRLERVQSIEEIQHPIVREALGLMKICQPYLQITSIADIPAGTGLGSSGSFTIALLKALHTLKKNIVTPAQLAEQACDIELNKLGEPIGKQDQYIAAYGGITCFKFMPDGRVDAWPLKVSEETLFNLEDNLLLFFTGYSRSASSILKEQDDKSRQADEEMTQNLHFTKEIAFSTKLALEKGDVSEFARLMNVHWQHKKRRNTGITNREIDELYDY